MPPEFDRKSGIGASECAQAMGVLPEAWGTPTDLWLVKTGRVDPPAMNEAMYWGLVLEPVVCAEYAKRTGKKIIPAPRNIINPNFPFLFASPDRFIADDMGLLEAKTARTDEGWGTPGTDQIPIYYMAQVQQQIHVTGRAYCDVAVLIGKDDFRIYHVERNDALWTKMLAQLTAFWACVKTDSAPAMTSDVIDAMVQKDGVMLCDSEQRHLVEEYRQSKRAIKSLEKEVADLANRIKACFGVNTEMVDRGNGELLATLRPQERNSIDTTRLWAEEPEIARRYSRKTIVRPLRLAGEKT